MSTATSFSDVRLRWFLLSAMLAQVVDLCAAMLALQGDQLISIVPGYEITRDGRVFSLNRNWYGVGRKELRQKPDRGGYPCVHIVVDGKRSHYCVHVLVARQHLPPCPPHCYLVRHLDGNKLNPHVDNLAWGTDKDNSADRDRHGRTYRGEANPAAIRAKQRRATCSAA